jgi:hypothetical protein
MRNMLTTEDLLQIRDIIRTEIRTEIGNEVEPLKSDLKKLQRDMKTVIRMFDSEYMELRSRVEKIEDHLNLPSN